MPLLAVFLRILQTLLVLLLRSWHSSEGCPFTMGRVGTELTNDWVDLLSASVKQHGGQPIGPRPQSMCSQNLPVHCGEAQLLKCGAQRGLLGTDTSV